MRPAKGGRKEVDFRIRYFVERKKKVRQSETGGPRRGDGKQCPVQQGLADGLPPRSHAALDEKTGMGSNKQGIVG